MPGDRGGVRRNQHTGTKTAHELASKLGEQGDSDQMPPSSLSVSLEKQVWGKDQGTIQKLEAKSKGERSREDLNAEVCVGFCWLLVCGFIDGQGPFYLQLAREAAASDGAIPTSKGVHGLGAAALCCSEATFQDDVVAIAAFCF